MFPFHFWTFILYVVYSTAPGGAAPYRSLQVNVIEFSEEACHATMTKAQLNPAPLIKVFGGKPATALYQVTTLEGWRCQPFEGVRVP